MTREEKAQIIEELGQKFSSVQNFYITDASGLTVEQINTFRKLCYKHGIEYKVIKNTLIKKALESLNYDVTPLVENRILKGFSGVLFSETSNTPAKILKEYRKDGSEKPLLKGASIESAVYVGDQIDVLSALKSKNELIGDIIGLLQSPAKNVISALQSGGQKISGVLKTLSERPE